ncbi:hypothetical protein MTO96_030828 [Rhipicephalus appendiculatus]
MRDPNRIMSDPVGSGRAKSPWTSTRMPNRTKMPNQPLHIPVPQALSPRFAMQHTGRKKLAQKKLAQRPKGAGSRLHSRSKRRSPPPPPARFRIKITESPSDESEMTKSAVQLLPQLTKKEPSPARSYKAITANKAAPTIAGTRKPMFNRPSAYRDHQQGTKPLKRHTDISSPSLETIRQPSCHIPRQPKCPENFIRTTYNNRYDVFLPNLQDAPHSNVVCRDVPAFKPTAVTNNQEPGPLCSSDNEELCPRTRDTMPLQISSLGSGARNPDIAGAYPKFGSQSPRNPEAPVQRSEISAETRRNHPRPAAHVRRTSSRVSSTSVISHYSGRSLTSGEPASSVKPTRTTRVNLCLATAAVLSFLAFYAITDAVLSVHVSKDHRGDPMTVRPDVERELGHPSKLGGLQARSLSGRKGRWAFKQDIVDPLCCQLTRK